MAGDRRHPPLDRGDRLRHRQALQRADRLGRRRDVKLILASQSAARRHMLEQAGVKCEAAAPELDEEAAKAGLAGAGFDPRGVAEELAQLKALSIDAGPDVLVLGSDQVLELDEGAMLSKPESREEALDQLMAL